MFLIIQIFCGQAAVAEKLLFRSSRAFFKHHCFCPMIQRAIVNITPADPRLQDFDKLYLERGFSSKSVTPRLNQLENFGFDRIL